MRPSFSEAVKSYVTAVAGKPTIGQRSGGIWVSSAFNMSLSPQNTSSLPNHVSHTTSKTAAASKIIST